MTISTVIAHDATHANKLLLGYYYYYCNYCQFKSQRPLSPGAEMSPSHRRRCRVELPPKDADVETLLNEVRGSQLPVGGRFP